MRFVTPVWSLELAPGWRADDRGEHAVIVNDDPDTTLWLASVELADGLTAAGWVERVAGAHRPSGRVVTEVRCGDFRGIRSEFAVMDSNAPPRREDRWVRVWTLECGGTSLDITYRCPLWCAGRDDHEVVAMLATLRAGSLVRPES